MRFKSIKKILNWLGAACLLFAVLGLAFAGYILVAHRRSLLLPSPTGPYRVGRTEYEWTDPGRFDPFSVSSRQKREVLVWVWYPADAVQAGHAAPYLPPAWIKARQADAGIGKYIESDPSAIQTHSFENISVSGLQTAYPVILMQPGMGPGPADYTVLAENLASHGYIVVGINQLYTSNLVVYPDGRAVRRTDTGTIPDSADASTIDADANRIGKVWTDDAVFVMDRLQILNADQSGRFHNKLDLAHLGLFGHSFGGATAASVCKLDRRCKAGADLDGTLFSYQAKGILQTPFMFMTEDLCGKDCVTMHEAFSDSKADAYYLSILGTRHFNFSDLPLRWLPPARILFRQAGYIGTIAPERGLEISSAYLVAFFDRYLKNRNSDLLQGPSPAYPEVQFEKH